jgi:hypothetical protein
VTAIVLGVGLGIAWCATLLFSFESFFRRSGNGGPSIGPGLGAAIAAVITLVTAVVSIGLLIALAVVCEIRWPIAVCAATAPLPWLRGKLRRR